MKKIYGVGINNANYPVNWTEDGKQYRCIIFQRWKAMLSRCYSDKPTPKLPMVCEEWLYFMNFHSWLKDKNYENYCLDKDILRFGNRLYSPENCILVPSRTNSLLTDSRKARGEYPLGVRLRYKPKKVKSDFSSPYESYCGFEGSQVFLGTFKDILSAHAEWQKAKIRAINREIEWLKSINFEDKRIYRPLQGRINILESDLLAQRITQSL